MTGCTALRLFSQGDPGVVHLLSTSTRVIRLSNVMVTSACDRGTAPTGATTSLTGGFERLRLRPHSEPTCSLGTRRDTSRRCGGLATVPSASVVLHVDARQEPERLTMAGYSEGVLLRLAVMRQDGTSGTTSSSSQRL
jgi:hypothetical protein